MQTQYILLVSSALKKLVTIFATSKRLFSAGDNIRVDNINEKPTFEKKKKKIKKKNKKKKIKPQKKKKKKKSKGFWL